MTQKTLLVPQKKHSFIGKLFLYVGVVILLLAVAGLLLDVVDLHARKTTSSTQSYAFTGSTVSFEDIGNGSVHITTGTAGTVSVASSTTQGIRKVVTTTQTQGDRLYIHQNGCDESLSLGWYGTCTTNFTITVPAGTIITAKGGNASFSINGVNGSHNLQTGDGKLQISNVQAARLILRSHDSDVTLSQVTASNSLDLTSGSGKVRLDRVSTPLIAVSSTDSDVIATALSASHITATSGDGKVTLQLTSAPAMLLARSNAGDVSIRLPHTTTAYRTSVKSNDGKAVASIKTDPNNANNIVTATSGDGNVTVSY